MRSKNSRLWTRKKNQCLLDSSIVSRSISFASLELLDKEGSISFVTLELLDKEISVDDRGDIGEDGEAVNVLEAGLTSVTSSMSSSKWTTSCIVSWWYSTISLKKRFSRAYWEFSWAKRAFSFKSVSSWSRIWIVVIQHHSTQFTETQY